VEVHNDAPGLEAAAGARLVLWRPSRDRIEAVAEVEVTLAPGQSTVVSHAFELDPSIYDTRNFGIWHVAVELVDAEGNLIRDEREALDGRFAVAYPREGGAYSPRDVVLTVTTTSERYLPGEQAHYDILVENDGAQGRDIRMELREGHDQLPPQQRLFTVAAGAEHSEVFEQGRAREVGLYMFIDLYDADTGELLAEGGKNVYFVDQPLVLEFVDNGRQVVPGSTEVLEVDYRNITDHALDGRLELEVERGQPVSVPLPVGPNNDETVGF
jgi:hypothetical protein